MRTGRVCGTVGLLLGGVVLYSATVQAQTIDHSSPNAGNDDLIATQNYNWGPVLLGGLCRLTDKGSGEAVSVFSKHRVNITQFANSFVFQILSGGPGDPSDGSGNIADGLTFTIQNDSPQALGGSGGGLGYEGMDHSVAIKFDPTPNAGDPSYSSTGLFTNGQGPYGGSDLLRDQLNLRSQHAFRVDMDYDGRMLEVHLTDLETEASAVQRYRLDIARTIGSRTAFVGFTAATGLGSAAQDIQKWYFTSPTLVASRNQDDWGKRLHAARRVAQKQAAVKSASAWPTGVHPTHPRVAARTRPLRIASAKK